jgi:hypothetical protein
MNPWYADPRMRTLRKESVGAPDQMTVSQHSKSEG